MSLGESERRRDGFREGTPVVLSDGQPWHFRRPTTAICPDVKEDGSVELSVAYELDGRPDYDVLARDLLDGRGDAEVLRAAFVVAVALLSPNYDLAPADYARLLMYRDGDPTSAAMVQAIFAAATGQAS